MDPNKLHNRWKHIHQVIKLEGTGSLRDFSKRIGISKSQLATELGYMKSMGAPISYCKKRKTYFYTNKVEFLFEFKINAN